MQEPNQHSPLDKAVAQLFQQFSVLASVGYSGGALPGEQGIYRLSVPLTGRIQEGLTVISNIPYLPYGASPTKLAQDAIFKWVFAITSVLQSEGPEVSMLHQNYKWEFKMLQAAEETRQLRVFREFLSHKVGELEEGGDTLGILYELRDVTVGAPTVSLRIKCARTVADNSVVRKAINGMVEGQAKDSLTEWLEPHIE